jgi:hypothetical protein
MCHAFSDAVSMVGSFVRQSGRFGNPRRRCFSGAAGRGSVNRDNDRVSVVVNPQPSAAVLIGFAIPNPSNPDAAPQAAVVTLEGPAGGGDAAGNGMLPSPAINRVREPVCGRIPIITANQGFAAAAIKANDATGGQVCQFRLGGCVFHGRIIPNKVSVSTNKIRECENCFRSRTFGGV